MSTTSPWSSSAAERVKTLEYSWIYRGRPDGKINGAQPDEARLCGKNGGNGNGSTQQGSASNDGKIKEFTAFFAVPGSEINDDNEVQQIIAEKTGVKVKETWLTGQTAEEAIGTLVAGDEYPDFICGGNGMPQLYDAGALVALDDYIDKYPNIKNYFTEQEWDQLRQSY